MSDLVSSIIIAIFVLFNGTNTAVTVKTHDWNLKDCNTFAKENAKDYEQDHPGETVVAYCFPIYREGI